MIDLGYIAGLTAFDGTEKGPDRRRHPSSASSRSDPDPARCGDLRIWKDHEAVVPGRATTGFDRAELDAAEAESLVTPVGP